MKKIVLFSFLLLISLKFYGQTETVDTLVEKKHKANLAYASLYKENSEMSYTSPGGELGAPSGYVINGRLTTSYMMAPRSLPIAFSINPDFTVRVRTDRSAGVRTPSFKLGGTFYVRLAEEIKKYKYVQLSFTHHSNGQDGDAILADGNINTLNGNFNTNYLTAAYSFGKFTETKISTGTFNSLHHKVGLAWHKWFSFEKALTGDYGFTRLNYDFSYRIYQAYNGKKSGWQKSNATQNNEILEKETWRFNAQASYAINKYNKYSFFTPNRRLNIEASANYSLPFMQNVFIMASVGYYGEDPYNIYFKDKYAFMRFGLSSTFTRFRVR